MQALFLAFGEWLVGAFGRLFASKFGQWIAAALIYFGISIVTSHFIAGAVTGPLASKFSAMGSDVVAWIAYLKIDQAITVIISAEVLARGTSMSFKRLPAP